MHTAAGAASQPMCETVPTQQQLHTWTFGTEPAATVLLITPWCMIKTQTTTGSNHHVEHDICLTMKNGTAGSSTPHHTLQEASSTHSKAPPISNMPTPSMATQQATYPLLENGKIPL